MVVVVVVVSANLAIAVHCTALSTSWNKPDLLLNMNPYFLRRKVPPIKTQMALFWFNFPQFQTNYTRRDLSFGSQRLLAIVCKLSSCLCKDLLADGHRLNCGKRLILSPTMPDSFCHRRHESIVRWQISRSQNGSKKQRASRKHFSITLTSNERAFQMSPSSFCADCLRHFNLDQSSRIAVLMEWKPFFIGPVCPQKGRTWIFIQSSGVKINYDKVAVFLHFSDPASHMIPDIANYIKSGWSMLKLDQLRWYLTKVGARKMVDIRYLMGFLCGQNKIQRMTPAWAGRVLLLAKSLLHLLHVQLCILRTAIKSNCPINHLQIMYPF